MKSLVRFKAGDLVRIVGIRCRGMMFRHRLCDLGLYDGTELMVLKNDLFGPMVLKIFNSKIALGRGQARRIYAEKV